MLLRASLAQFFVQKCYTCISFWGTSELCPQTPTTDIQVAISGALPVIFLSATGPWPDFFMPPLYYYY